MDTDSKIQHNDTVSYVIASSLNPENIKHRTLMNNSHCNLINKNRKNSISAYSQPVNANLLLCHETTPKSNSVSFGINMFTETDQGSQTLSLNTVIDPSSFNTLTNCPHFSQSTSSLTYGAPFSQSTSSLTNGPHFSQSSSSLTNGPNLNQNTSSLTNGPHYSQSTSSLANFNQSTSSLANCSQSTSSLANGSQFCQSTSSDMTVSERNCDARNDFYLNDNTDGLLPATLTLDAMYNTLNSHTCQSDHMSSSLPCIISLPCVNNPEKSLEDLTRSSERTDTLFEDRFNGNSEVAQCDKFNATFWKSCKCRICKRGFGDVFSLNFHVFKVHEKTSQPTCIRCSAKFSTLYSLFLHLKKHKRILSKQIERQHQMSLPDNKKLLLPNSIAVPRNSLKSQTKRGETNCHDTKVQSIFHCGECGKEYKHKKTLMNHVKFKHLGMSKKRHRCGHCHKSFSSRWQLTNHVSWWHLGRKPYVCEFCQHGFVCRPTLKRHQQRVHTGEKPYKCLLCHERFYEKAPLDLHKAQMHTGVFPFICSQCGRGFVQRCYLKSHLKIHSGQRPYKCVVCGKQYSKISHLKRHKISCAKKIVLRKFLEMSKGF